MNSAADFHFQIPSAAISPTAFHSPPRLLAQAPSDAEKYKAFTGRSRWPLIGLFLLQFAVVVTLAILFVRNPEVALGLVIASVLVPPLLSAIAFRLYRTQATLEEHIVLIEDWRRGRTRHPSVEILIPTSGYPLPVLENAFRHALALDWGGRLRIRAIDSADNVATEYLARNWGLDYDARPIASSRHWARSVASAFTDSSADVLVVLDARFVPRPDFLWETVPYLEDASIGAVRTDDETNIVFKRRALASGENIRRSQRGRRGYRILHVPITLTARLSPRTIAIARVESAGRGAAR